MLERAIELAKAGAVDSNKDLTKRLSKEGYGDARMHLSGTAIQRQIRTLMQDARVAAGKPRAAVVRQRGVLKDGD